MRKYVLLFTVLFLISVGQVMAKTKSEILNEIRLLSQDANADNAKRHYSPTTLETRADAAQIAIIKSSLCLSTYTYTAVNVTTATREYSLPSDLLVLTSINLSTSTHKGGAYKKLEYTTRRKLDTDIPAWESTAAGTPTRFFTTGNHFDLYPTPSTTTALHIRIDYTPKPILISDLGDDGDPFVVGNTTYTYLLPYHDLIVNYVTTVNKLEEQSVEANYYNALYINGLSTMIAELNATPDRQGQILYTPK